MRRAERVERFVLDKRLAYENGGFKGGALWHWVDTTQSVADGCQSSEIGVAPDCGDPPEDTVVEDVALGVKLGRQMKPEDECFFATVHDSDGRALHFFFVAPSEDVVVERLIEAFRREAES